MNRFSFALWMSCSIAGLQVPNALAEEPVSEPTFRFSGFYSLTGVYVGKDNPLFLYAPQGDQDKPAEGEQLDFSPDSKLGVMGSVHISDSVSSHVQLVARRASSREPLIRPRLAYVEWRPSGEWTIQAGRYVFGLLMVEDAVYVDYGNVWLRPPQETYANVPKTELDGVNLAYTRYVGDWTLRIQGASGASSYYSQQFHRQLENAWGVDSSLMNSNWTLRLAHRAFDLTFEEAPDLLSATSYIQQVAISEGRPDIAGSYSIQDINVASDAFGLRYESERWICQAEVSNIKSNRAFVPETILSGYAMLGVRSGRLTPYAIYGKIDEADRPLETRLSDPSALATANYLRTAVKSEQSTVSLGVRWDFSDAHALKFQWDRISRTKGIQGWFVAPPAGNIAPDYDNDIDVVSVSLQGTF